MNKRTGLTLIEVIICSMVFMFIATALASITQIGLIVDREDQISNEMLTNMIIGRRFLLEGAPKGSLVGDKGLLQADSALRSVTTASLEEDVNGLEMLEYQSAGEMYHVWVAPSTGELVRHRVSPLPIGPREKLMGDPLRKIKVAALESRPFFQDTISPGFVVGSWVLYEDRNANNVQDMDELSLPFRFAIALRNAM